jgi:hypothetical protein
MEEDNLWGKVNIQDWHNVSFVSEKVAVEDDVKVGRAVFYLQDSERIGAKPMNIRLPSCAIWFDEESKSEVPVIVIQAEEIEEMTYVGFRFLEGGNGICTLAEIELLSKPDERFF